MNGELLFALQVDCECTKPTLRNAAAGERNVQSLRQALDQVGTLGTFLALPGDLEASSQVYRALEADGHEVGLHLHIDAHGRSEFMGDKSADEQRLLLGAATDRFAQVMGRRPTCFCPGYFSANDSTFEILVEAGLTHGAVSCPTRVLRECASVWAGSSLDPRYPHRHNRILDGDVDFVDLPVTIDPESRMWGGAHPLDLRVELVDAKNHWYTIDKSVRRQVTCGVPVRQLHALTHNTYEYGASDFRRQTLVGMVAAAREIAVRETLLFKSATLKQIAEAFRQRVPRPHPTQVQP